MYLPNNLTLCNALEAIYALTSLEFFGDGEVDTQTFLMNAQQLEKGGILPFLQKKKNQ